MLGFPRSARLLTGDEFRRVFDQRRAIANDWFRVHFAPGDEPRLGLAVSRRVAPRAVDRNRIRRQIRETFRHMRPELIAADFVVLARPPARTASRAELRAALNQLWQRMI
ncbi:MAG: ribonuclease P protein component [Wenzhouxiangella sp.]|nr:ribonuclease P protein component [Wenzhouxiangella sp.]